MPHEEQNRQPQSTIREQLDRICRYEGVRLITDAELTAALAEREDGRKLNVAITDAERFLDVPWNAADPGAQMKAWIAARNQARGRPLTWIEQTVNLAAALVEPIEETEDAE